MLDNVNYKVCIMLRIEGVPRMGFAMSSLFIGFFQKSVTGGSNVIFDTKCNDRRHPGWQIANFTNIPL
jgi:hypothetical protein